MIVKDGKKNRILMVCAVVLMAFLAVGTLVMPDREKSENENRYLAGAPKFDLEDILSGEFEEDSEKYLTDQIIGREQWISLYSITMRLGLRKDINGVYLRTASSWSVSPRTTSTGQSSKGILKTWRFFRKT